MKKWSHFSLLSYADVSLFSISSFHWWLRTAWHNLPHSSNTSETTDHSFRSSVIVDIYRYFRTQHTCNFYWPKWISYCLRIKLEGACVFFFFCHLKVVTILWVKIFSYDMILQHLNLIYITQQTHWKDLKQ